MNPVSRSLVVTAALGVLLLVAYMLYDAATGGTKVVYSQFLDSVSQGRVAKVVIRGTNMTGADITGEYKEPPTPGAPLKFTTHAPDLEGLVPELRAKGVTIESLEKKGSGVLAQFLLVLPILVMLGIWIAFMRQMQGSGAKAMSFGKSRARLLSTNQKKATFKDVAGCDEAKEELQEIIEFLRDPQKFVRLGGKIPKGVLLVGHPGTGKTLLARAVAGEANVPFFSLSGSDFVEMFVGVGASRVRDLFEQGKKNAPCIIFIDEIDAVGRHRGAGLGGGHDEREQTLNALLVEMDGFETNEGVIIIAATNRPDVLDPALQRPGRFDRRVVVGLPDVRGREGILRVHTKKIPVAPDVDLDIIARGTPGFSGADLANLVNEAALAAARQNKKVVYQCDLDAARDKIVMGAARRSMLIPEKERKITAYHEAGHALTSSLIEDALPVHKVTIIPHAMALGVTQFLQEDDRHTASRRELKAQLAVALGGRAAEHLVFDEYTTGAADDIKKATDTARRMVSQWGMSDAIGPVGFADREHEVFLGRDLSRPAEYSEQTAQEIDAEVRRIMSEAWDTAVRVLGENRAALERVAMSLLERETLNAVEFKMRVEGRELPPIERAITENDGPQRPLSSGTEGDGTAIPVADVPEPTAVRQPQLRPLGDS